MPALEWYLLGLAEIKLESLPVRPDWPPIRVNSGFPTRIAVVLLGASRKDLIESRNNRLCALIA